MKLIQPILVVTLLVITSITSTAQEKVYLPFFEALNMNQSYQYSVTKLYRTYLNQTGRYEVILSEKRDSMATAESLREARESAEAMNASYIIMGELNRVGEVVVVSLSMYSVVDGKRVWGELQKADSPEDLDPIMEKLANVTGTSQKIEEQEDIYNVTDYDSQRLKTKRAIEKFGISIGGAYPFIADNVDEEVAGGFGLLWSFDSGNLIFDIKGEGYFNKVNSLYFLSIDVNYPFLKKANTPFVLGGIGWGGMTTITKDTISYTNYFGGPTNIYEEENRYNKGGMMGFIGGGYILNRTSSVQLKITAKGFYSFYELVPGASPSQPFGAIFSVAVMYDK